MRIPHNIEKSAFRKGEYVGYCYGVWNIERSTGSYGNWIARPCDLCHGNMPEYAWTLAALGKRLEAIEQRIKSERRA